MNTAQLAQAPAPAATEPDPPTAEEAARLLGEAWAIDPDWGLLLWLTMVTGSRRGEVSAVRWHHVDLAGALLTCIPAGSATRGGRTRPDGPATASGCFAQAVGSDAGDASGSQTRIGPIPRLAQAKYGTATSGTSGPAPPARR